MTGGIYAGGGDPGDPMPFITYRLGVGRRGGVVGAGYRGCSLCGGCDDGVGGNCEESGGYGDEGEGCVDELICSG